MRLYKFNILTALLGVSIVKCPHAPAKGLVIAMGSAMCRKCKYYHGYMEHQDNYYLKCTFANYHEIS